MKKCIMVSFIDFFVFMGIFIGSITPLHAEYPEQNITWIVGYKPGGGFDTYSRAIGKHMKKFLPKKVNVVVTNKPGSASQIAASAIFNSKPDGYTIGIWPMPGLYVPQMFHKPKYDVKKVTWLATVLEEPMCLAISAKSKFRTLKDLQKAETVKVAMTGFTGPEITAPIAMETLGIKAKYITGHKGSKAAMLAAMRGDGDVVVFSYGSLRKQFKKKTFIPVLVMGSKKRISAIKDVPTATEAGHAELDEVVRAWRVIGGPPNIPKDRTKFLRDVLWKTMNDSEFLAWSKSSKRAVSPLNGEATEASLQKVMAKYDGMRDLFSRYIK